MAATDGVQGSDHILSAEIFVPATLQGDRLGQMDGLAEGLRADGEGMNAATMAVDLDQIQIIGRINGRLDAPVDGAGVAVADSHTAA